MKTVKTDNLTLEVDDDAAVLCAVHKPTSDCSDGSVIVKGELVELFITLSILNGGVVKSLIHKQAMSNEKAAEFVLEAARAGVGELYKDIDDLLTKQEVQ